MKYIYKDYDFYLSAWQWFWLEESIELKKVVVIALPIFFAPILSLFAYYITKESATTVAAIIVLCLMTSLLATRIVYGLDFD
jgi:hypothetical protein